MSSLCNEFLISIKIFPYRIWNSYFLWKLYSLQINFNVFLSLRVIFFS